MNYSFECTRVAFSSQDFGSKLFNNFMILCAFVLIKQEVIVILDVGGKGGI